LAGVGVAVSRPRGRVLGAVVAGTYSPVMPATYFKGKTYENFLKERSIHILLYKSSFIQVLQGVPSNYNLYIKL